MLDCECYILYKDRLLTFVLSMQHVFHKMLCSILWDCPNAYILATSPSPRACVVCHQLFCLRELFVYIAAYDYCETLNQPFQEVCPPCCRYLTHADTQVVCYVLG